MQILSPGDLTELDMEDTAFLQQYLNESNKEDDNTIRTLSPDESSLTLPYTEYMEPLIDFLNWDNDHEDHGSQYLDNNAPKGLENSEMLKGSPPGLSKLPLETKHRVIAERKRREKLNQRFIALSALIPCLKKMDKASILGDAIGYIKQLEEKVQSLEGQVGQKSSEEQIAATAPEKRSRPSVDNEFCLSNESFEGKSNHRKQLPHPEVRVSNKHVLVRIHCNKQNRVVEGILSELDKFHLKMLSGTIVAFGDSALDITVVAQMSDEFGLEVKDFVGNLKSVVRVT